MHHCDALRSPAFCSTFRSHRSVYASNRRKGGGTTPWVRPATAGRPNGGRTEPRPRGITSAFGVGVWQYCQNYKYNFEKAKSGAHRRHGTREWMRAGRWSCWSGCARAVGMISGLKHSVEEARPRSDRSDPRRAGGDRTTIVGQGRQNQGCPACSLFPGDAGGTKDAGLLEFLGCIWGKQYGIRGSTVEHGVLLCVQDAARRPVNVWEGKLRSAQGHRRAVGIREEAAVRVGQNDLLSAEPAAAGVGMCIGTLRVVRRG